MSGHLHAQGLHFTLEGTPLLHDVSLDVRPGEWLGLLGPNGAGKSTLLRLLAGVWRPDQGEVRLDGRSVHTLAARERARHIALVPQQSRGGEGFTVGELISMGRYAHQRAWAPAGASDRAAVAHALETTDTTHLQARLFGELSGGEQRRVLLARALAQTPEVLLLDEPTTALDLGYQVELMELVAQTVAQGSAVISALHDPDLAARYAGRLALLSGGRIVACGPPDEVLTEAYLAEVFGVEARVTPEPLTGGLHVVVLRPKIRT